MKYVKHLIDWISHSTKEIAAQVFTLLGFFIAWVTLTGAARDLVGFLIVLCTVIWIVYMKMEGGKDDENETD